jgi:hypothetical protein
MVIKKDAIFFTEKVRKSQKNCDHNIDPSIQSYDFGIYNKVEEKNWVQNALGYSRCKFLQHN